MIQPSFVLATGDITDAKSPKSVTSRQYEAEWQAYHEMLDRFGVNRKGFWFDLRGNHDCFSVGSSVHDYFSKYSVQKTSSYMHRVDNCCIVAIDGCPAYGLPRPYNFFGSLDAMQLDQLESHLALCAPGDHVLLIGHYPTPTLQFQRSSSGKSFAELTNRADAYFTGHLHQLVFGVGTSIKAMQPNGLMDLEVADLKDHSVYRVVAIDRGQLSFADVKLGDDPVVCITNPADARLLLAQPLAEIRVLVFSPSPLAVAKVWIDGAYHADLKEKAEHLWTCAWSPQEYADGRAHTITVEIGSSTTSQSFRLGGRLDAFNTFGERLLRFDFHRLVYTLLVLSFSGLLVLMFGLGAYAYYKNRQRLGWLQAFHATIDAEAATGRWVIHRRVAYSFLSFTQDGAVMLQLTLQLMYMACGPWFFGPLTQDGTWGAVFLFGILSRHGWTIMLDTWFYALFHLAFLVIPSVLILVLYSGTIQRAAFPKDRADDAAPEESAWYHSSWARLVLVGWFVFNCVRSSLIMVNYGVFAALTSPVYTWYPVWFAYTACTLDRAASYRALL